VDRGVKITRAVDHVSQVRHGRSDRDVPLVFGSARPEDPSKVDGG